MQGHELESIPFHLHKSLISFSITYSDFMLLFVLGVLVVAILIHLGVMCSRATFASVTWINQQPRYYHMASVFNPFELKLLSAASASLQGIDLILTSRNNYIIQDFWGVEVHNLHEVLQNEWLVIRDSMMNGSLLKECYHCCGSLYSGSSCKDEVKQFLPSKQLDALMLGTGPRMRYPLVIIMIQEDDIGVSDKPVVWGLVSIIHIKDEIISLETHFVSQLLKLSNNRICEMKNLYVSSAIEDNHGEQEENVSSGKRCVVCQIKDINVAFLPCRHTCVCKFCFQKLDKCPMCRSMIHIYFDVA